MQEKVRIRSQSVTNLTLSAVFRKLFYHIASLRTLKILAALVGYSGAVVLSYKSSRLLAGLHQKPETNLPTQSATTLAILSHAFLFFSAEQKITASGNRHTTTSTEPLFHNPNNLSHLVKLQAETGKFSCPALPILKTTAITENSDEAA